MATDSIESSSGRIQTFQWNLFDKTIVLMLIPDAKPTYPNKIRHSSDLLDSEVNFNNAQNVPIPWKSTLFRHH